MGRCRRSWRWVYIAVLVSLGQRKHSLQEQQDGAISGVPVGYEDGDNVDGAQDKRDDAYRVCGAMRESHLFRDVGHNIIRQKRPKTVDWRSKEAVEGIYCLTNAREEAGGLWAVLER